ncbi:hypothetical protein GCM10009680_71910 [Streptomyces yatensis]|uniref:Uncharacterized protein n=1 Tax=Streptomyces yatensis TaxID=155177 RepID=A0ABN2J885_9ACTN
MEHKLRLLSRRAVLAGGTAAVATGSLAACAKEKGGGGNRSNGGRFRQRRRGRRGPYPFLCPPAAGSVPADIPVRRPLRTGFLLLPGAKPSRGLLPEDADRAGGPAPFRGSTRPSGRARLDRAPGPPATWRRG